MQKHVSYFSEGSFDPEEYRDIPSSDEFETVNDSKRNAPSKAKVSAALASPDVRGSRRGPIEISDEEDTRLDDDPSASRKSMLGMPRVNFYDTLHNRPSFFSFDEGVTSFSTLSPRQESLSRLSTAAPVVPPIALVQKNKRDDLLHFICHSFLSLYRNSKHIGVAKLTTAVPVSQEVEERIRKSASTLLHAHMEMLTEVNPSIEGGFIFDINDYRLDASVATQMKRVKQQFIDKNRRIV